MPTNTTKIKTNNLRVRPAKIGDANALYSIEVECFSSDRLSLRRFQHWIRAANRIFWVAEDNEGLLGYGLAFLHRGTRLTRLYSLAVTARARGRGVAKLLLQHIESEAVDHGRLYMRLEVANDNTPAIQLYQKLGYQSFGTYEDYYEDHRDALRMQKRIRYIPKNLLQRSAPWHQQHTDFTCGPAALMMAMASLNKKYKMSLTRELDIWRESTTIFMTSGHGGCHPVGLALAATRRGYEASVYLNTKKPLFIESVRNARKKEILTAVDKQYNKRAKTKDVKIHHRDFTQNLIEKLLEEGAAIIILISTYRLDGKKTPHWVTITGIDNDCLYFHDPDPTKEQQVEIDCQNVPISRLDFDKMSAFGSERLRTAVVLRWQLGETAVTGDERRQM
jgi:ribosomal protein S18 acetylase RimI-like enzyme